MNLIKKKIRFLIFILLGLSFNNINSQNQDSATSNIHSVSTKLVSVQVNSALKKGDIVLDAYYGFPSLIQILVIASSNELNNNEPTIKSTVSGIGPVGLQASYFVEDKYSVGLDVNYLNIIQDIKRTLLSNSKTSVYYSSINAKVLRVMVGGEYHIAKKPKLDVFIGARVGMSFTSVEVENNDPIFYITTNAGFKNSGLGLATRIFGGIRYFPVHKFGFLLEGGVFGGGIIRAGISLKL
jgi:hypothetical protein